MKSGGFFGRLRQFDAYPKTLEDFRVKTFGGATVTIVSAALMLVLFCMELNYYLTTEVHPELFVDTSKGQKLKINIDVTFPRVGCSFLGIDAMDVSGEQHIDIDHNMYKQRLDERGITITESPVKEDLGDKSDDLVKNATQRLDPDRCESCYGAETDSLKCCNTCDDVREAYRRKGWAFSNAMEIAQCKREGWADKVNEQKNEGCRIYGYIEVNKVAGNFHIAPGRSYQQSHTHVHDLQAFGGMKFNLTHTINHLSFGTDYPGQLNPLDASTQNADRESMMFQYFVKIVPTTYVKVSGEVLETNQFSVTRHQKMVSGGILGEQGLPGMFVTYELSPMLVKYTEKNRSFTHFLTGVCAIIGGVFTVAGLIDSMIYHSAKVIQKKIDLGKAT